MEAFDILLVDDNQIEAQIFETAMREASTRARIYWVSTGKEALEFLRQQGRFEGVGSIHIVVLDRRLGGDDGMDVLREIKTDPDISRTPVIMLTSSKSQDDIDLAYSLGANAYFRKPVSLGSYIDQLRTLAQHWLDMAELPSGTRRRLDRSSSDKPAQLREFEID